MYVDRLENYVSHFPASMQKMRENINKIDAVSDIKIFVQEKNTGIVPPKPTDFVFVPIRVRVLLS